MKGLKILCFSVVIAGSFLYDYTSAKLNLDKCLKLDSISCLQLQIYRTGKQLFSKEDMWTGRSNNSENVTETGRSLGSLGKTRTDEEVLRASDVTTRQTVILGFFGVRMRTLWRSLTERFGKIIPRDTRSLLTTIDKMFEDGVLSTLWNPTTTDTTHQPREFLMPFLLINTAVALLSSTTALAGIALVAKKALLAALVSILVTGYIGIKDLLVQYRTGQRQRQRQSAAVKTRMTAQQYQHLSLREHELEEEEDVKGNDMEALKAFQEYYRDGSKVGLNSRTHQGGVGEELRGRDVIEEVPEAGSGKGNNSVSV